jgi:prepilin-type N-terminal cleavage/methylation domain-containing protein
MRERDTRGFTLVELLVVMGIIALLAAALITGLTRRQDSAHRGVDAIRLHRHWENMVQARLDRKPLPPRGGAELVYWPWVSNTIERTPENLEACFVAGSMSPRLAELLRRDARTVLTRYEDITSADTDFAGRSAEHYTKDMLSSGHEALLATDNEHGNTYADGAVLVLYGNGAVRPIHRDDVPETAGDPDAVIEVGPGSPVAALRALKR